MVIRGLLPASGYGSTPAVGSTINVGSATVGSSVSTNLQVSETGNAALNVTSHSLSGANMADFSVTPATLTIADGGAAQNLAIQCTPSGSGLRSATLTVNHNASGSPATYTLNCTGAVSINTSTGSGTATFNGVSSDGVAPVTIGQAAADCGSLPTGYIFPHGFFDFNIKGVGVGGSANVTINLPKVLPSTAKYFMCKNGNWITVPMSVSGNNITVQFQDGVYDADTIPGQITDPGGTGVPGAVGGVAERITLSPMQAEQLWLKEYGLIALGGLLLLGSGALWRK